MLVNKRGLRNANLAYLRNKPRTIRWEVIAGPPLTFYESYDLIFDSYDLKIRKLDV